MAKSSTSGQKKSTTSTPPINNEEKHLQTLLKHKHIFDLYEKTGEVVSFSHEVQNEVLEAYRVYDPHYHYQRTCPVCVAQFLNTVYTWLNKQL